MSGPCETAYLMGTRIAHATNNSSESVFSSTQSNSNDGQGTRTTPDRAVCSIIYMMFYAFRAFAKAGVYNEMSS